MVYIKTAIVMVIVCIGVIAGLMFATFDAEYELEVALDAFLKEENSKAESTLNRLDGAIPGTNLYLYRSYIARARGDVKLSQIHLTEAVSSMRDEAATPIQLEVYLNRALNAYLLKDWGQLSRTIVEAQGPFSHDPWVHFFEGVYQYYAKADMESAMTAFNNSSTKAPLSPWMKKAISSVFTPLWEKLRLTHCYIEQGDYLKARQILEQQSSSGSTEELSDVNLLIGITYLKEALEKPVKAALPYYKLAFSYIENVPVLNERYNNDRKQIIKQLVTVTEELVNEGILRDIPFYATLLENLRASEELNQLRRHLVIKLDEQITAKEWPAVHSLTALLNRLIVDEKQRQQLSERFEELLTQLINDEQTDLLNYYWEVVHLFNKNPDKLTIKISKLTIAKILQVIPNDDASLTETSAYIAFLKNIEQHEDAFDALSRDLIACSEMLWMKNGQEGKALSLMKKAQMLAPSSQEVSIRLTIEKAISSVYEKAIAHDELDRLPALFDAIKSLHLEGINIGDTNHINDHLKVAAALYNKGQWEKAHKQVRWILHLDPKNSQAIFLDGMIAYCQGNYKKAIGILENIEAPSKSAEETIAVCQYLVGDRQWGQQKLDLLALENALSDETFLRIGFGLLTTNNNKDAISWFGKILPATDETIVGLAFAAYKLQNWETTLSYIEKLSESYRNTDEVQTLEIEALKQTGQDSVAEARLKNALEQPQADTSIFSPPFVLFLDQLLSPLPLHDYSAQEVVQELKQNEETIEVSEDAVEPTLKIPFEQGRQLVEMGDFKAAYKELLSLIPNSKETILPLLARAAEGTGRSLEANQYFTDYFAKNPSDTKNRGYWAITLMNLRRYDKALEQFLIIRDNTTLSEELLAPYIRCLVRTQHMEEAVEQTELWLKKGIATTPSQKLNLLQQMVIPQANGLIITTLRALPSVEKLSLQERIDLSTLFYNMGHINRAYKAIKPVESEIKELDEGKLLLVNIYQSLSKPQAAWSVARDALDKNPLNADMIAYVYGNEKDPARIRDALLELRTLRKKENLSITEKMLLARTLVNLSRSAARTTGTSREDFYLELRETYYILDQTVEEYSHIPEIHFLMGELALLTNHKDRAMKHYIQASSLDPSYSNARRALGNLHRAQSNIGAARENLTEATKYQPSNAGMWSDLAALHLERRDFYEAKLALYNAIRFKPGSTGAYVSLAKVLLELKNPEDAKVILERAVRLSPDNIDALKLLLTCLYDRSTGKKLVPSPSKLRSQKVAIYEKIYAIDPLEAKDAFKGLDKTFPSEDGGLHQQLVK